MSDKAFATSIYRSSVFTDHCYEGFHFCDQAKVHQFCNVRLDQHWWDSKHSGSRDGAISAIKYEVMVLELCTVCDQRRRAASEF